MINLNLNLKLNKDILFRIIVVLFFLLPSSSFVGGPSLWFMILLSVGCTFLIFGYERYSSQNILYFTCFFLFFLITVLISIIRSYQYVIVDDLLELLRVSSLLIFLFCGYFLSGKNSRCFLVKFFIFFLIFQFLVVILQKIEPLKAIMSLIWNMDKSWTLRGTGTLSNPNVLGLMSIFSMLFIYFFATGKKTILLSFIICSLNVLLSGSRTALIVFLVTSILVLFISGRITPLSIIKKTSIVFIFSLLAISLLIGISGELRYMGELLKAFEGGSIDLTRVGTFNHRVGAWERQFSFFEESGDLSVLIGMGPGKGIGFRVMDNDYLAQYIKYGLTGVILNLILLLSLFLSSFSSKKVYPDAAKFIITILFAYSVYAISSASFLSLLNMIPIMLITGFLIKVGFKKNEYN